MRRNSYFASRLVYSFFLLTVILFSSLATASPAKADELVFSKTYTISRRGAFFAWGAFASSETGEGVLRITKNTPDKRIRSGHMLLPCEQRGKGGKGNKGNKGHGKGPKKCWPRPVNLTRFLHSSETVFELDVTIQEFNAFLLFLNGKRGASITVEFLIKGEEPPPLPTAELFIAPVSITQGEAATLTWHTENAETVTLSPIDGGSKEVDASGSLSVFPETDTTYTLTAENASSTVTAQASIEVVPPVYEPEAFLTVDPTMLTYGSSATLTWTSQYGETITISPGIDVVGESGSMSISPEQKTTYTLTVENSLGVAAATATVDVRPDVEPQPEGSFGAQYEDLIPVNTGLESYSAKRFALITGHVQDISGAGLSGVTVAIHDHPEYGTVLTDQSGKYTIPVEGGGAMTLVLTVDGYITSHRKVIAPWNDIVVADLAVLITQDTKGTEVTLDGDSTNVTLHESTPLTDEFGTRSVTVVFTGDNRAYETDAQGNDLRELTTFTTRASEFPTEDSMPAKLPIVSGFTWCADFRIDGAARVRFEKPVIIYVDNFLNFPVGEVVPVGYYDRDKAAWIAMDNGVVVMLLDDDGDGEVDGLDVDGDMAPDDLDGDGDTWNEITGLDQNPDRYKPGDIYWRAPLAHFSPVDLNWPWGPQEGDIPPNAGEKPQADKEQCEGEDCDKAHASYVNQRSRVFHEDIPIPGTGMTLHYASSRAPGYKNAQIITVPVSGPEVPSRLNRMEARVKVAGKVLKEVLDPEPNKMVEIIWDSTDHLGRPAQADQAEVEVSFIYPSAIYSSVSDPTRQRAFAELGSDNIIALSRAEYSAENSYTVDLPQPKTTADGDGLAQGWTLSSHHSLVVSGQSTLFKGDGSKEERQISQVQRYVPEGENWHYSGDVAPDGSYFFSCSVLDQGFIKKITYEGEETTVFGGGDLEPTIEGVPADRVKLTAPLNLVLAPDDTIYVVEAQGYDSAYINNRRILRIKDGTVRIWAGAWEENEYSGDGGPATDARFRLITWLAADHEGNLFVSDQTATVVRRIDPDGYINTYVGTGFPKLALSSLSSALTLCGLAVVPNGDEPRTGLKAIQMFFMPLDMGFDAQSNMYLADGFSGKFMRIDASGTVTVLGGMTMHSNHNLSYPGDGPSANLERYGSGGGWHFDVDAKGDMYTMVGDDWPYSMVHIDTTTQQMAIEGQTDMEFTGLPAISLAPDGSFYVAHESGIDHWVRTRPGWQNRFEDDGVTHVFDENGRHLHSEDTDTGVVLVTYGYDVDGNLERVTDRFGNEVRIELDSSGYPTAIVAPDGQRTSIQVDGEGRITSVSYEDGGSYSFEYDEGGLMTAETDPAGWRFTHTFDEYGRIIEQNDPEGGRWTNSRERMTFGTLYQEISAEGVTTSYEDWNTADGFVSMITDGNGAVTEFYRTPSKNHIVKILPNGLSRSYDFTFDPVRQERKLKSSTATTPGGLSMTSEQGWEYTDSDGDGQYELITRTATMNGKTATSVHDVWAGQVISTSPEGRSVVSTYDPVTLLTQSVNVPGLAATSYEYDVRGRVTRVQTADRHVDYTYDSDGWLESVTDAKGLTTSYDYDEVGRVTTVHRPDGSTTRFTYDKNGNMRVLTTPSDAEHEYEYNGVGAAKAYYPPLTNSIVYEYDRDRRLTRIDYPSGKSVRTYYELDRVQYVETPEGDVTFSYYPDSQLQSMSFNGESIGYTYDASLVRGMDLSGTLNTSLNYAYDDDFRLRSFTYAGESEALSYDLDGLLTSTGDYAITREPDNGLATDVSGNGYAWERAINQYGETDSWTVTINGSGIAESSLSRDETGRITGRDETVAGITHSYEYEYDDLGRLTTVTRDGEIVESYEYNGPHNARSSETNTLRGLNSRSYTYDLEDHLLSAGGASFTYDDDGYLRTKTVDGATTTYTYSSRGELLQVDLPDGRVITYKQDPQGRRIAKELDGVTVEQYLWSDRTTLLAVYDGSGNVKQRFEYAAGRMPVSMTVAGSRYYLVYDQVGTLRAVVDGSGNVVKSVEYDSFGNVIEDSAPAFTVLFGFAGGLFDSDTGLVRFGFRDYDADVGRWTAKDPIQFAGGDTDLYGYCVSNPVNLVDVSGLRARGHHYLPESLRKRSNFSPEVDKFFKNSTTGWIPDGHGWSEAHARYNEAVGKLFGDFLRKNGICPEKMTLDQAKDLLDLIKSSKSKYIKPFLKQILDLQNKVMAYAGSIYGIDSISASVRAEPDETIQLLIDFFKGPYNSAEGD